MTAEPQPRPYRAAAIIGLLAQLLFTFRVTTPHKLVFDETHYIPAAKTLMTLSGPANIEHPLLGKELIALGIMLFGDNSLGWRIMSTFAATAVVLGIFAILWLLFGKVRTATMGALFVLLNITVFIQARIGMLDGFMAAFVVTGIAALIWAMRGPPEKVWRRWLIGSALLGLAVGAKWAAAPYIAYAAIALIAISWNEIARAQRWMERLQATTETARRHQALMKLLLRRNRQRTAPLRVAGRTRGRTADRAQSPTAISGPDLPNNPNS